MSDHQPPPVAPPPFGNGGYPPFQAEPPPTGQATAALALGIAGLSLCPGIASIPAWIIGRAAMREIDASAGRLGGRTLALVGYVLGIVGTVLAALGAVVLAIFLLVALVFASHVTHCHDSFNPSTGTMTTSTC